MQSSSVETRDWPVGGGEMGTRIRTLDWATTPLGPTEQWPASLRAALQLCLDSAFPMTLLAGPEQVLLYNDAYRGALGVGKHPWALGRPYRELWPELWEQVEPTYAQLLAGGPATYVEDQPYAIDRDGVRQTTYWAYALSPVRDEDGTVVGIHGVGLETTARVRAEVALRESQERQAFLLKLSDTLRPLADPVEIQSEAARVLGRHLGASRASYAEVGADDAHFAVHRDYTDGAPSYAGRYLLDSVGPGFVKDLRDGRTITLADAERDARVSQAERAVLTAGTIGAFVGVPLVKSGRLAAVFSVHHPAPHEWSTEEVALVQETAERTWAAVERARAEAELRASEERYRTLFESVDEGFAVFEMLYDEAGAPVDFRYVETNPAFERQAGRRPLPGQTMRELFPEAEDMWLEEYAEVARTGQSRRFVDFNAGLERWFEVFVFPTRHGANRLAAIFSDVTEKKRAEEALRESEAKYRSLFDSIDEGFCIFELVRDEDDRAVDYRFVEVNEAFERQTGLADAVGKLGSELVPGTESYWLEIYGEVVRTGEAKRFESYHQGTARWYDVYATLVDQPGGQRVATVFKDVTERKQREERQSFLLRVSDALRAQPDEQSVEDLTVKMLAEHLLLDRCYLSQVFEEQGISTVGPEQRRADLPPMSGVFQLSDYPETMRQLTTQPMVIPDAANDPGFSDSEKALLARLQLRALLVVPLRKGPRKVIWALAAAMATPRRWTEDERLLLEEVGERAWAAIERARAEAALRESEERHAFLVRFSDAVRGLANPRAVAEAACRLLAERLGVERAYWAEVDWATREYVIGAAFHVPGTPVIAGRFPLDAWEPFTSLHLAGRPIVVDDTQADARIPPSVRDGYAQIAVGADLAAPVAVDGQLRCTLAVNQRRPRRWTTEEVALVQGIAGRCWAEVERARAEAALEASEARQTFLVRLNDALRPLSDPVAVQVEACRQLGSQLGANRVSYAEVEPGEAFIVIHRDYTDGVDSMVGRFRLDDFGPSFSSEYRAGRTLAVADASAAAHLTDAERAALAAVHVRGFIGVPLIKPDGLVALLGVHLTTPRAWTADEIALVEETAERTWAAVERARAEEALRDSERRMRRAMSVPRVGVLFFDLAGHMHEANAAFQQMSGYTTEELRSTTHWDQLTAPEFLEVTAERARDLAEHGETPPYEKQMIRKDGTRWWGLFAPTRLAGSGPESECVEFVIDISETKRAQEALGESEARLRRILDSDTVGVVFFDQAGTLLEANTAFWQMTGYTAADAKEGALSWRTMTPPEWVAASEAQMQALAATGRIGPYEKEYQRKNGTRLWLLFTGRDLGDGTIVEFVIDVSERKRLEADRERLVVAEAVTAERAALLESVLDALADGVLVADERLQGILVNPAYRALYRLDLDPDFFRRPAEERARTYQYRDLVDRAIPAEAWPAARAQRGEVIGGNDAIEARSTALDGTTLELSFTAGPIRDASGRITGTVTAARDIRARRAMEMDRERLLRERQALLDAVVRAQEEERRHLARELHDEIGQALTGLQLQLAAFARGQNGRAAALDAEQIVRDLTARVSELSVDLRPSALDTLGLLPALLSHVERYQVRTGLHVELRHDGLDRRFAPPVEITAYRVVQEALTNVARHADARNASVQLLVDDDTLTLAVRDDGRGFDLHASRRTGGLSGMRERLELLGGTLTVDTAPERGTLITAELPLHEGAVTSFEEDGA